MARHDETILWRTAAPLWRLAIEDGGSHARFKGPALLRFAGDDFMERYLATLAESPRALAGRVARFETFETPRAGWLTAAELAAERRVPKLFQPAHARFYLVCASLVCERLGLPDRRLDAAADESVFFLLRRLAPASPETAVDPKDPATFREQGWLSRNGGAGWVRLSAPAAWKEEDKEERLPLFPTRFELDGHPRTVLAGLVPVSSRESWMTEGAPPRPEPAEGENDPREDALANLRRQVLVPEASLPEENSPPEEASPPVKQDVIRAVTDATIRNEATLVFLLELQDFLASHFEDVWTTVAGGGSPALPSSQQALLGELNRVDDDLFDGDASWAEAITAAYAARDAFYGVAPDAGNEPPGYDLNHTTAERIQALIDELEAAVAALIEAGTGPPVSAQNPQPKIDPGDYFVIRCVFDRPKCRGLEDPVVSDPGPVFEMAGFFDAEAPARAINIRMPDISLAALSRYRKGVTMTLNRRLREQMKRFEDFDFGDPGGGAKGSFGLGMICSFSLPIITIVALILLIVMVFVLNIVFWWVPFFRICFPIPKVK
jgi:hypothetical protein